MRSFIQIEIAAKAERPEDAVRKKEFDVTHREIEESIDSHGHNVDEIEGLPEALEDKADANDPRFELLKTPEPHSGSHSQDGADPIKPSDIGALGAPPGDGKRYLATAAGWVEYMETTPAEEVKSHTQLENRDAPDQHPQSSIQYLEPDLRNIREEIDGHGLVLENVKTDLLLKAPVEHGHPDLVDAITSKAAAVHTHTIEHVTGLDTALASKAVVTYGTENLTPGSSPLANGAVHLVYE